jgi:hypothetical protein
MIMHFSTKGPWTFMNFGKPALGVRAVRAPNP